MRFGPNTPCVHGRLFAATAARVRADSFPLQVQHSPSDSSNSESALTTRTLSFFSPSFCLELSRLPSLGFLGASFQSLFGCLFLRSLRPSLSSSLRSSRLSLRPG